MNVEKCKSYIISMQKNLKCIRFITNVSAENFSEIVGCTKQTINKKERGDADLTKSDYITIRFFLDQYILSEDIRNRYIKNIGQIKIIPDDIKNFILKKVDKDTLINYVFSDKSICISKYIHEYHSKFITKDNVIDIIENMKNDENIFKLYNCSRDIILKKYLELFEDENWKNIVF